MIGFINHLNGIPAALLLCTLLFIDEVGVPLPFAPNEILLLLGGLLIGSGALAPWLFVPLALAATVAGMMAGYGWARALGPDRLRSVARRVDAEKKYGRAEKRLRSAGPGRIAVARLLPGVRVYATLVSGASGVTLRPFVLGGVPALAIWVFTLTLIGDLLGRPAERLLSRVDAIMLTGVLTGALAVGAVLVIRHVPRDDIVDNRLSGIPRTWRWLLALSIDVGIVGCLVTGVVGVAGHFFQPVAELNGIIVVAAVVVGAYVAASRGGAGATLGESLSGVDLRSAARRRRRTSPTRSG